MAEVFRPDSIAALQEHMRQHPHNGETTRDVYEQHICNGAFEHDGLKLLVNDNYRCLETYHRKQRMVIEGVYVTVYVDHHRCESFCTADPDAVPALVQEAATKARTQCAHEYGRELSQAECRQRGIGHYGNCWHVYECPKCHETFSVDSSG